MTLKDAILAEDTLNTIDREYDIRVWARPAYAALRTASEALNAASEELAHARRVLGMHSGSPYVDKALNTVNEVLKEAEQ